MKTGFLAGLVFIVLISGFMPRDAQAQSDWNNPTGDQQGGYQAKLIDLSHILGQLHHLRGQCVSGERQLWRDNMMELVRLENPRSSLKNEMVEQFNKAYDAARLKYSACDRKAGAFAAEVAHKGEGLAKAVAGNIAR